MFGMASHESSRQCRSGVQLKGGENVLQQRHPKEAFASAWKRSHETRGEIASAGKARRGAREI